MAVETSFQADRSAGPCLWAALLLLLAACQPAAVTSVTAVEGFGANYEGEGPMAFGVVTSDYSVASISLLGPEGEMLAPDFIHSGSAPTRLVTTLSGDVVLPTRSGEPGILTLLDRFRTDVLTRVDPEVGRVLGQMETHAPDDGSERPSYSSNPQDYVYFGERDAWVTRFEPNLHVDGQHPDRGLDLLHVDPSSFERGERISLWHLNSQAERVNPDTGERQMVPTYARPASMVRLGDRLVVGLSHLSASFDALSEGTVALVDPQAKTAKGLTLSGLKNCGVVAPVPGDPARVVAACQGYFRGVPRESAGLAILVLEQDTLRVEHVWRGADHPDTPLAVQSPVPLGGTRVVAAAFGQGGDNDVAYVLDIETGETEFLFEAQGAFKVGSGAFNAHTGVLLVPDASTDAQGRPLSGVRSFRLDANGVLEDIGEMLTHDILPPRLVRAF